jgi:hypothetical protein
MPAQIKGQQGVAGLVQESSQVCVAPTVLSQPVYQANYPFGFGFWLPTSGIKW